MTGCVSPLSAWLSPVKGAKPRFSEDPPSSGWRFSHLACRQCIACRLNHSMQWAVRCMHEKRMHASTSFLTLTYNSDNLPEDGNLVPDEVPLFNKRLRDFLDYAPISTFYCGEYGDRYGRPHYHQILFGYDPPDKRFYRQTRTATLWTSDILDRLWGLGNVIIGSVDFDSCAYVARYSLKKKKASDLVLYSLTCPVTGEIFDIRHFDIPYTDLATRALRVRHGVFARMSNSPAIGLRFLEQYSDEIYNNWSSVFKGIEVPLPRYYKKYLEQRDPSRYNEMMNRLKREDLYVPATIDQLRARDLKVRSRMKYLTRSLEL